MKNNQITKFFIWIFIISIPIYVFSILTTKGIILTKEAAMLSIPLMTLPPIIVAVIFIRKAKGSVKQLLKESFDFKKISNKKWYFPIIFLLPVIFALALGIMNLLKVPVPDPVIPYLAFPIVLILFFILAIFEEVGWMGYIYEPMQEKWGTFKATNILGFLWALWHLPMFIYVIPSMNPSGASMLRVVALFVSLLGLRVLLVWIYKNTGKSIFAVIFFHAMYNVSNTLFPNFISVTGTIYTVALITITAILVRLVYGTELIVKKENFNSP